VSRAGSHNPPLKHYFAFRPSQEENLAECPKLPLAAPLSINVVVEASGLHLCSRGGYTTKVILRRAPDRVPEFSTRSKPKQTLGRTAYLLRQPFCLQRGGDLGSVKEQLRLSPLKCPWL
jgi:hypothetical protein